jgi:GH24 family phage-related lysozyme (muramidase)
MLHTPLIAFLRALGRTSAATQSPVTQSPGTAPFDDAAAPSGSTAEKREKVSSHDSVTCGPSLRAVSPAGVALIKRFEGCARRRPDGLIEAYPDPATGGAPWTIGWGATGEDVRPGTVWTKAECDERLAADLERYAAETAAALGGAPTSQAQFDALVSFHYNTGAIARATLTRKHVAGDHAGAEAEFGRWKHAGGKVMRGLVRRRRAEAALYREGTRTMKAGREARVGRNGIVAALAIAGLLSAAVPPALTASDRTERQDVSALLDRLAAVRQTLADAGATIASVEGELEGLAPVTPEPAGDPLLGKARVEDGFDPGDFVREAKIPGSGKPDVVGAFRFLCGPHHLAYADPIVSPNKPSEHLHVIFGNTLTSESSTYESLRRTGESTCRNEGNRSAYWVPAVIGRDPGNEPVVIMPAYFNIYYKRRPASDPYYAEQGVTPVRIPRGLRFVFGGPDWEAAANHPNRPYFKCIRTHDGRDRPREGHDDLAMRRVLSQCGEPGDQIQVSVTAPRCWDGQNLDSADHKSHMAFPQAGPQTGYKVRCPRSHPYEMATFTLHTVFEVQEGDRPETWEPSSAMMAGRKQRPWDTWHADWFGAWNDDILARWQNACIDRLLSCSSGNLGDGGQMTMNDLTRRTMNANLRLPVPVRDGNTPATGHAHH